jgi:hypothetical protein
MAASRPRRLAALVVAAAVATVSCTTERADDPRTGSETPTSRSTRSPAATASPDAQQPGTPLVIALHPTRAQVDLTPAQVRSVSAGDVVDWAQLGQPPAPLRVGTVADVMRDRDAVAVVAATEVVPPLTVATVAGVDPLRRPAGAPAGRRQP